MSTNRKNHGGSPGAYFRTLETNTAMANDQTLFPFSKSSASTKTLSLEVAFKGSLTCDDMRLIRIDFQRLELEIKTANIVKPEITPHSYLLQKFNVMSYNNRQVVMLLFCFDGMDDCYRQWAKAAKKLIHILEGSAVKFIVIKQLSLKCEKGITVGRI